MSVSKPALKKMNMGTMGAKLTRTESVAILDHPMKGVQEEKDLHTSSLPVTSTTEMSKTPTHPKGHKVRVLNEVWENMDKQAYLHLTDTLTLMDVWVQPMEVETNAGTVATVKLREVVMAPHLKYRDTSCKMSTDDLLKMLYLNDSMQYQMQGFAEPSYEEWLNEKTSKAVKVLGVDCVSNRGQLCNYIIRDDKEFSFYPTYLHGLFGVFFRKICYHSYKNGMGGAKMINPSMIKCSAGGRSKFEYVIEARIFSLPSIWFSDPLINKQNDEE